MHALYSTSFTKKKNKKRPFGPIQKRRCRRRKSTFCDIPHRHPMATSPLDPLAHWPIGLTGHAFFWSGWMVEQGFIDVTQDRRPTPSDVHNKPIGSKSGCPQVDSGCSWKMLFATCTFWTELSFDKRATSMPKSWQSHQSNTR